MKLTDILVKPTKYSNFRCDTYKKFSANPGILYPVWWNMLNPGESASIDLRHLIRTWPTQSPTMASMKVRFVTVAFNLKNYAMALEGYNRNFDWRSVALPHVRFLFPSSPSENTYVYPADLGTYGSALVNIAYLLGVRGTSLADYLNFPNGWLPSVINYANSGGFAEGIKQIKKSFIPFLCYYDFYRNYLINPQEGVFPMFTTRFALKKYLGESSSAYYLITRSVVQMKPISLLDDLVSNCHKYYDGQDSATLPLNSSSNSAYAAFSNLFTWVSNPSYFNPTQATVPEGVGNTFSSEHGGLVSTMFDSDVNTQWLSIDNYQKLNDVKMYTQSDSNGTFTSFVDIVKASSLWDFFTRSVNSDGTYGDFIGNQFGVTVKGDMNIPQIVHVYDSLLSFDDITSQSDTSVSGTVDGAVVGQQFGVGRSYGQSNYFKVRNLDGNYVILMTFMWATPTVCYHGGLNQFMNITSFSDLYQPAFDNYAMQPRLQEQLNASIPGYTESGIVPFISNPTELPNVIDRISHNAPLGYQPAWSEYKTDVDVVHGLFRKELDYYTVIRDVPYITNSNTLGVNNGVSSYVYSALSYEKEADAADCKRYSLPFQINEDEDCLQVQLRVGCTITRAMSKNVNPNIK